MSELKPEFQKALSNMAEISPETIVRIAQDQGSHYQSKRIKTNQIRNFYGEVNAMKLEFRTSQDLPKLSRRLVLLKPKLAYAAGRQSSVKDVYDFVSLAIDGVQNAKHIPQPDAWKNALQNFFELMESVVAYHKFYEN